MARPTIPPELGPLLVDVAAELRRLKESGFLRKLRTLDRRQHDLPAVVRAPFGILGLVSSFERAEVLVEAVDLLGLNDPPPRGSSLPPRGRKREARTSQDEAWLRRQLDGLGETGGGR